MSLDFTGISLPFTGSDIMSAGMGLLGIVITVVLLGMAFKVAPKVIDLVFSAFK